MADIESGYVLVKVDDQTEMALFFARPGRGTQAPALIVLQEAFGVNDHIREVTERCARAGYLAVAPELFHRTAERGFAGSYDNFSSVMQHFQAVTEESLAADLRATLSWLQRDSQCDAARIGAIGFCMGGRAAFFANAILPLRAAAAFYGGGIAPTYLPHAAHQHGPLLLIWGGLDQHIDLQQRHAVADALRAADKNFVEVEYSDADHGFFCDARPSYNAFAASESWALTLAFFSNRMA
ncbi:MAG TPA: dienelactone hydrolase family protein [Spongiibacteraceae bacterium]|nr:dienelactone hydrolase family protein [Spongiibacteraceae bacterium]